MRPSSKMKARILAAPTAVRAPAPKPESTERVALMKQRTDLDAGMKNARKLLSDKSLEKRAEARIKALREQVTAMPDKAPGIVMVRAIARNEAGLPIPLIGARVRLSAGEQILAEATVDPGGMALLVLAESIKEAIPEDMESGAKREIKPGVKQGPEASVKASGKEGMKPGSAYEVAVLTPDGRPAARDRGKWNEEGTAHVLEVASSKELEPYLRRGAGFARALAKAEDSAREIVKTLGASLQAQIAEAERRIDAIDRALARHNSTANEED